MLCFFFQAKYDGQVCVLKEFNLREEKDKALFLNEVKRLRTLQHPCVVSVEAVFVNSVRVHSTMATLGFIQLPFYAGGDLGRWLVAPERISDAKKQLVLRTALQGLMYVHERGIVHCDVKPANIFLNRRDKPKVLDFGIARVAQGGDPTVPLDGPVAGSPHYLAPEQLQRGRVDARTDVHALGVVFYELLTGRKAYEGDTFEKITQALMHSQPPPAHEFRPGVPLALSNIAAKAMAHDPADRYRTAGDFSRDLRRWLDTQPQPARPRSAVAVPDVDDEVPPVPAPAASRRPVHLAALLLLLASAAVLMLVAARR